MATLLDIYDDYRWRNLMHRDPAHAWSGLSTDPSWQDCNFKKHSPAKKEFALSSATKTK